MNGLTLSDELENWVRSEVASGRADSPTTVLTRAVSSYRYQMEALRRSLDEAVAQADRDGWLSHDEVFDRLEAKFPNAD